MTPKETFKFMRDKKMDLKELMLLEHLDGFVGHVLTNTLVTGAVRERIASPATAYKYLARLKRRKYVKDVRVKDQDKRCQFIQVTDIGKSLLKEWG